MIQAQTKEQIWEIVARADRVIANIKLENKESHPEIVRKEPTEIVCAKVAIYKLIQDMTLDESSFTRTNQRTSHYDLLLK